MQANGHPPRVHISSDLDLFAADYTRSRWPSLIFFSFGVMAVLLTREGYCWFGVILGEFSWEEWTVKLPS